MGVVVSQNPMRRTVVLLPGELKKRAEAEAAEQGVSLGEIIRRSLAAHLDAAPLPSPEEIESIRCLVQSVIDSAKRSESALDSLEREISEFRAEKETLRGDR